MHSRLSITSECHWQGLEQDIALQGRHDGWSKGRLAKGRLALVVDGQDERRSLDRRRACDRLDARLGPTVGQAKGEAAEGRVRLKHRSELLQQVVECSVASCCIARLDVDLDLDCVLVIDAPEAAEGPARARPDRRLGG